MQKELNDSFDYDYPIERILVGFEYESFNLYNINEARSGQIRWADAIYTSKGIREKMITQFGEESGTGW